MVRVACLLIGYVCGLFQTAYIYGRINGIDIREHGSGNSGTTNALRVLGKKAGLIVFAGDILKILAAGFLVTVLFNQGDFFGDRAALYSLDSEDSAALTTLPQGAALQVLKADCGRDGTWARVLYAPADAPAQLTGYVRMAQLNTER